MKPTKMPEWGIDEQHREPYFECPKMKQIPCCCCNACPLDWKYPRLIVEPGDPDQKCTLSRPKRLAIAARHPDGLKYHGLTVTEWKWRRAWERLPAAEKERRKAVLIEARARLHRPNGGKIDEREAGRGTPRTPPVEDDKELEAAAELARQRARFEAALVEGRDREDRNA